MAIIFGLCIVYWDLLRYGIRQAKGQLEIVWNAEPIEFFLDDPDFPDSLKHKLRLIQEVRQYAIDSLGLKDTKNYKKLYDQKGKELMWVVTASAPFELKEKEWRFPVVGAVPYKGYFDKELADAEQKELEKDGWDVLVLNPGGWSTLGWFDDPILSGMLSRSEGDLASLIIHELVHATVFIKDSVDFNENLASFIGDRGAERFLKSKYGKQSHQYLSYIQEELEFSAYVKHVLRGCNYLDSLYAAIGEKTESEKIHFKEEAIRRIMLSADSLQMKILSNPSHKRLNILPNNAYFMSYRRYQSKQDDFWLQLHEVYSDDIAEYIKALTQQYPYL